LDYIVAERRQLIILRAYHSLQEEPSRLSVYVNSLNISHDDLKTALTAFHPCPETQRRFDAGRQAVNRDTQLTEYNEAIKMAKESGDSVREEILRRNRKVFITRSAVSWANLVRTTLEDREEWESQLEELEVMPSGSDTEESKE
jgi:hypothetical protein